MSELQKALVLPTPTDTYEVQSVPRLKPASGQVLVKILAAALNPADWKMPGVWPKSYPIVYGFDGAGEVVEVASDVADFSQGDRVTFQGWYDEEAQVLHGTFQQYIVVPTYIIAKIPDEVSFEEGATLFSGIATAANPFYSYKPGTESLRLSPPWEDGRGKYIGKSILVVGGSAQIGQFAIQFAKLSGYSLVIVTASPHNASLLKHYGATHVIDRKLSEESILAAIRAIAGGPVDIVYDAVSEDSTLSLAAAAVREGGQAVVVQPSQEEVYKKLFDPKRVEWVIARGIQSSERNRGALAGLWRKLPELLTEGALKPTKYDLLLGGLTGVPGGLERMRRNEVSGVKLVLHPHDIE